MRSIYGSILLPLTLVLFCEAYPASDSKFLDDATAVSRVVGALSLHQDSEGDKGARGKGWDYILESMRLLELTADRFARLFAQYEKLKSDYSDVDMEEMEVPDFIKEVWNPRGMTSEDLRASIYDNEIENRRNFKTPKEVAHDYAVDKRAPLMGPFKYHACYFNPVTCYGK